MVKFMTSLYPDSLVVPLLYIPWTCLHSLPLPLQIPQASSVALESMIQSQPIFLQIPEIHISRVPKLHGVPSVTYSPNGTIKDSSAVLQKSSHGSSEKKNL